MTAHTHIHTTTNTPRIKAPGTPRWVGPALAAAAFAAVVGGTQLIGDDNATTNPSAVSDSVAVTQPMLSAEELAFIQGSSVSVAVEPLLSAEELAFIEGASVSVVAQPMLSVEELAFIEGSSVSVVAQPLLSAEELAFIEGPSVSVAVAQPMLSVEELAFIEGSTTPRAATDGCVPGTPC